MRLLTRLLEPKAVAYAHCDLPCGVYDPAQARIEAESVKAIEEKYQQNTDPEFRARCLIIYYWAMWTKLPRQEMLDLVNRQAGEQELPDTGIHH